MFPAITLFFSRVVCCSVRSYKGFYTDQNLAEKVGHLGSDVKPPAPVRQVFPVCPNLPLPGPGEAFLNDGQGENQYILHLHLLSQAFNGRFQKKVCHCLRFAEVPLRWPDHASLLCFFLKFRLGGQSCCRIS